MAPSALNTAVEAPTARCSGGEGTDVDVVAHVAGFVVGALLGACAALPGWRRLLQRVPQWLTGAAALASIVIAWACALSR